ncbi:hypothetical protein BDQ94DRAFT_139810 [Aspergillus welwitschiae]|uniref:Uncharacterized protein n=1 Tax=Aspergillus welwitschiae TaxID=1341132 RepID=A0A3F3Q8X5_9EURO|nr:hypothetical protein BDQ94DRAFT_139810 [Aspergillus welwitschiae]RDH35579.1 hypothetical protein BDQ94DRAFT_139810 [Aspergillus welwitschiae]
MLAHEIAPMWFGSRKLSLPYEGLEGSVRLQEGGVSRAMSVSTQNCGRTCMQSG